MRDLLALDRAALQQSLAGVGVVEAQFRWIPSIGQMVMGFILPFALAFVAIPLESFIHSLRSVLGMIVVGVLRTVAVALRLVGNLANHACKILGHIYDLIIMVPLGIERLIRHRSTAPELSDASTSAKTKKDTDDAPAVASKPKRNRSTKVEPVLTDTQEVTP